VLGANGDFPGNECDYDFDVAAKAQDENPGSVAALVRLGAFEYLTCGDATSDDWKKKADTEVALVDSNAIPGGDGQRYTVTSAAGFSATYSAVDPPAGQ